VDSFKPFLLQGRQTAAQVGANVLYLEKPLMDAKEVEGLRFIAYRVQYKEHLISPDYLAALSDASVYVPAMEADLARWEKAHLGKVQAVFKNPGGSGGAEVAGALANVKKGTPVRLVLQDGSDYKGTYDGLGEDDEIWIRPEGWIGLLTDRSFQAEEIQGVEIFN
jgi:hypothetical protein